MTDPQNPQQGWHDRQNPGPQHPQQQGRNQQRGQGQRKKPPTQSGPNRPTTKREPQPVTGKKKTSPLGCAIAIGITLLVFGLPVFFAGLDEGWFDAAEDGDMTISVPTEQEATALVAELAEAEEAHGICYGWRLTDFNATDDVPLSVGSSRGVGVQASEVCERWAEMEVDIDYEDASSSFEDSAYLRVSSSGDLRDANLTTTELDRMGLTSAAAIDDPAAVVGMGALAVPLFMVEAGKAEAVPVAPPTGEPAVAISRPGSDFLGNSPGAVITLWILGGITAVCVIIGTIVRVRAGKRGKQT